MKFKKRIIASITILIFAGIVITLAFKFNNNTTTQSGNTTNSSSEVNVTEESKSEITVPKKEDKKEDIKTEDKEQKESEKNVDTKENKTESNREESTDNNKNTVTSSKDNKKDTTISNKDTDKKDEPQKQETKKEQISLIIIDEVNSNNLLSCKVDLNGTNSLEDIMKNTLKDKGVSSRIVNGYISMMYNLRERDAGPLSGWIFYVNGVKSPVGISGVYPKNGDTIEWKFVKDGVNN